MTAFINKTDGSLLNSTVLTPYYNLSSNYEFRRDGSGVKAMWNCTALVSYWILNDTDRLILYTHQNNTYTYQRGGNNYYYSSETNEPTYKDGELKVYNVGYKPMIYGLNYNPWVLNVSGYPHDLLYIAQYGEPNNTYILGEWMNVRTFDGAYNVTELKNKNSTVKVDGEWLEIMGLYVVGYAMVNSTNYLLDQGAAYLYQLHDAYGVPSVSQIQGFHSGNHTGDDAITFTLHGYSCVYTSRIMNFTSNPNVGLASLFVRGSTDESYYRGVADKYLTAHNWTLNNAPNYPKINYSDFEKSGAYGSPDLLQRFVYHQAALDQISNVTMGAAVDPTWYAPKTSGFVDDSNQDDHFNTTFKIKCSCSALAIR